MLILVFPSGHQNQSAFDGAAIVVTSHATIRSECRLKGPLFDITWSRLILGESFKPDILQ
jgi:hypothetical protein